MKDYGFIFREDKELSKKARVISDLTKQGTSSPSPFTATFAPARTGEDKINKENVKHKKYFIKLKNFILKIAIKLFIFNNLI